jgi:hypothetical protein
MRFIVNRWLWREPYRVQSAFVATLEGNYTELWEPWETFGFKGLTASVVYASASSGIEG